jgi:hypothetical protein
MIWGTCWFMIWGTCWFMIWGTCWFMIWSEPFSRPQWARTKGPSQRNQQLGTIRGWGGQGGRWLYPLGLARPLAPPPLAPGPTPFQRAWPGGVRAHRPRRLPLASKSEIQPRHNLHSRQPLQGKNWRAKTWASWAVQGPRGPVRLIRIAKQRRIEVLPPLSGTQRRQGGRVLVLRRQLHTTGLGGGESGNVHLMLWRMHRCIGSLLCIKIVLPPLSGMLCMFCCTSRVLPRLQKIAREGEILPDLWTPTVGHRCIHQHASCMVVVISAVGLTFTWAL